jgi:hypothetical protein
LSLDAVHASETLVAVAELRVRFDGVVGGVVSTTGPEHAAVVAGTLTTRDLRPLES